MTTTSIDIDRLNAALDAEPWLTLRALADAHEERGEDAPAAGYRWLVENRRVPMPLAGGKYCWQVDSPPGVPWPEVKPHLLPRGSLAVEDEHLARFVEPPLIFPTPSAAYRAAAEAVGRLLTKEAKA